jgi:hypothetical protein
MSLLWGVVSCGSGSDLCPGNIHLLSVIDKGSKTGAHAAVSAGINGDILIGYADLDKKTLKIAGKNINGWSIEEILPDKISIDLFLGRGISISRDAQGNVYLAFLNGTDQNFQMVYKKDAKWELEIIDPKIMTGFDNAIAVDNSGIIHTAYIDFLEGTLKYTYGKPGSWTAETVDSEGNAGNDASIAVSAGGKVHISYFYCGKLSGSGCTDGDLRYALRTEGSFKIETVDSTGDTGWWTSIALDNKENVHIAYFSNSEKHLKYADNSTGKWLTENVDKSEQTGEYASISVHEAQIFIAYYDRMNMRLKLARKSSGKNWKTIFVDEEGTGTYASLAFLEPCGLISAYYDEKNGALKTAGF